MTALPRLVGAALALVLGTDAFLLYGALVAHPVTPSAALARYRAAPGTPPRDGPAPGVYLYDTTGYARVDALGVTRDYPRVSARIVRGHGCGWREEVPLFREHVETYDHCGGAQVGFATRLVYFLVPSALRCEGSACGDATATVTTTEHGWDPGSSCHRRTVTTVLRGSNDGGAVRRLCVAADGLVVTEERSVGVVVRSAFVGTVTYTESATFRLRSRTPLT